jgi:hypothetical protein
MAPSLVDKFTQPAQSQSSGKPKIVFLGSGGKVI